MEEAIETLPLKCVPLDNLPHTYKRTTEEEDWILTFKLERNIQKEMWKTVGKKELEKDT